MIAKLLAATILVAYFVNFVNSTVIPYGFNPNYAVPNYGSQNSASGGAVGGRVPQANGAARSSGYGPSINVNPVNSADSESDAYPSNTQQANLGRSSNYGLGGYGCGYLFSCV